MKPRRFNFVDPFEAREPPAATWLTRTVITSVMAGTAILYLLGYAHI